MQIAVFGGSFDPIHIAHVAIVNKALDSLDIDKVIVVPTYLNPFKSSFHLKPEIRFKLLKKVFQDYKNVDVSDYEINQQKSTYSIDTVIYLKNLYKASKIYFIIGADNIKNLNKWHEIDYLKSLVEFVVVSRNGYENMKVANLKVLDININISSSALRDNIDLQYIPTKIRDDILNLQKKEKGENF